MPETSCQAQRPASGARGRGVLLGKSPIRRHTARSIMFSRKFVRLAVAFVTIAAFGLVAPSGATAVVSTRHRAFGWTNEVPGNGTWEGKVRFRFSCDDVTGVYNLTIRNLNIVALPTNG